MDELIVSNVYDEILGFSRCYTNDGKLVILLSKYGWSSWTREPIASHLLMNSKIVNFFIQNYNEKHRHDEPMKTFLQSLFNIDNEDVYEILGGIEELRLAFIPKGCKFQVITEGLAEYVSIYNEKVWRDA
uniref:Uncharacterized protein n=1 Tax=viral metagenome TaxID=1070528 RepID=A0A6C0KU19_9ZZZZ